MKIALPENWKSRKWIIALLAIVYALVAHVWPEMTAKVREEDIKTVANILLTWLGVEGAADVVSRWRNGK